MKTQYQNRNTFTLSLLFFTLLNFYGCKTDPSKPEPAPPDPNNPVLNLATVSTGVVKSITSESAQVDLDIIDNGGSTVTESGVCWSRSNANPTLETAHKSVDGKPTGSSTATLTDLNPLDRYFARAYATNSKGTAYGEVKQFQTEMGSVTDISGNTYHTITIGKQVWMKENLKTVLFRNGQEIPLKEDNGIWRSILFPAYCWYNNEETNKDLYGALYNWYTVNSPNQLAPEGWRVPSQADFEELKTFAGLGVGGKLKSINLWEIPNTDATNQFGFSANPAGTRDAFSGSFAYLYKNAEFWTTSKRNDEPILFTLYHNSNSFVWTSTDRLKKGASVRCLREIPAKD
jgi:uncharacterized protein (TIGR02145 family)